MPDKKTITYDEGNKGWTSFHSYTPEWMTRLGTKFYTFKAGELYEHDSGTRSNFYGSPDGCTVTLSVNKAPSDVKLFKNLILETNSGVWSASMSTDLETGSIANNQFNEFESYFSTYIRQGGSRLNFNELTIVGIGNLVEIVDTTSYRFANDATEQILTSGTDNLYFNSGSTKLVGTITSITGDTDTTLTRDVVNINAAPNGVTTFSPSVGNFMFVAKDISSESRGIRGYYCSITLSNSSSGVVELFSVGSETVKSYL
jgi:hypothetical protein